MAFEALEKYAAKRNPELKLYRTGSEGLTYTHVSTGVFILDFALNGGYPENCAITLVGKQHSGKTTLAYKAIGEFQRKYDGSADDRPKRYCAFIDVERGYNKDWARKNGVNTDELYVVTPTNAEEAVDYAEAALSDPSCCLVVFDSIPALVGGKELEKSAEDHAGIGQVALHANRMFRKLSHVISKAYNEGEKKTFIAINQWRTGISTGPTPAARTMPGGTYARHYASVEIEVYNVDKERVFAANENDVKIASMNGHSFKIHKNRTGNSITEGEFDMWRTNDKAGEIDDLHTVINYAQKFNYVGGAGQGWWYVHPDTGEVSDKFKSKTLLTEHVGNDPDLRAKLAKTVLNLHRKSQGMSEDGW